MLSLVCYYYDVVLNWSPDHVNNNRHIVWNWFSVAVILMMFKYVNVICWIYLSSFSCSLLSIFIQRLLSRFISYRKNYSSNEIRKRKKKYCLVITVYRLNWLLCQWIPSICRWFHIWSLWALSLVLAKAGDKRFLFPNPKGVFNDILDLKNHIAYILYIQQQLWIES